MTAIREGMNKDLLTHFVSELPPGWYHLLESQIQSHHFASLCRFLSAEIELGAQVFPDSNHFLRAFKLTDYSQVKVVVVGQDPYHDVGQANGLAFAVDAGQKVPPSLRNIFKELASDLGAYAPQNTTLEGWAQQGVLLINSVLSVRAHEPFSHRGRGWEQFTERAISSLNDHPKPLVFLLWGAPAQEKARLITDARHLVLKAPHPSPLSAHRGFFGCRHFSTANSFLDKNGREPINWLATHSMTR